MYSQIILRLWKTAKEQTQKKTQVFNVIILDRSGSMGCIRRAAVDGFNETLSGIKKAQENFADTQDHYVTLVTFCSCEMRQVFDKVPAAEARPLTMDDYEPCCGTPLYDAMGFTLTAMQRHVKDMTDTVVVVTVITDGYENASREYSGTAIKELVERLRGKGWTFTYMGANQDAASVATAMSIRNSRNFENNEKSTRFCMEKDINTRMNFFSRLSDFKKEESESLAVPISAEKRRVLYTAMADEAFDEEERK